MSSDDEPTLFFTLLRIDVQSGPPLILNTVAVELKVGKVDPESAVLDLSQGQWSGRSFFPPLHDDGHAALCVLDEPYQMTVFIENTDPDADETLFLIGSGNIPLPTLSPNDRPVVISIPLVHPAEHATDGAAPAVAFAYISPTSDLTTVAMQRAALIAIPSATVTHREALPAPVPVRSVLHDYVAARTARGGAWAPSPTPVSSATAATLAEAGFDGLVPELATVANALQPDVLRAALRTVRDMSAVTHALDALRRAAAQHVGVAYAVDPDIYYNHSARVIQRAWRAHARRHGAAAASSSPAMSGLGPGRGTGDDQAAQADERELVWFEPGVIAEAAAVTLQSVWRGCRARRSLRGGGAAAAAAETAAARAAFADARRGVHPSAWARWRTTLGTGYTAAAAPDVGAVDEHASSNRAQSLQRSAARSIAEARTAGHHRARLRRNRGSHPDIVLRAALAVAAKRRAAVPSVVLGCGPATDAAAAPAALVALCGSVPFADACEAFSADTIARAVAGIVRASAAPDGAVAASAPWWTVDLAALAAGDGLVPHAPTCPAAANVADPPNEAASAGPLPAPAAAPCATAGGGGCVPGPTAWVGAAAASADARSLLTPGITAALTRIAAARVVRAHERAAVRSRVRQMHAAPLAGGSIGGRGIAGAPQLLRADATTVVAAAACATCSGGVSHIHSIATALAPVPADAALAAVEGSQPVVPRPAQQQQLAPLQSPQAPPPPPPHRGDDTVDAAVGVQLAARTAPAGAHRPHVPRPPPAPPLPDGGAHDAPAGTAGGAGMSPAASPVGVWPGTRVRKTVRHSSAVSVVSDTAPLGSSGPPRGKGRAHDPRTRAGVPPPSARV